VVYGVVDSHVVYGVVSKDKAIREGVLTSLFGLSGGKRTLKRPLIVINLLDHAVNDVVILFFRQHISGHYRKSIIIAVIKSLVLIYLINLRSEEFQWLESVAQA
jgi:hypothetical protein